MELHSSTIDRIIGIAHEAGAVLMKYYQKNIAVDYKDDHSPVTIADKEASALIASKLGALLPDVPIICEEGDSLPNAADLAGAETAMWLIDPLDGTRAFINGEDEFCVCMGLVIGGRPHFGVIHGPAVGLTYVGGAQVAPFVSRQGGIRQPLMMPAQPSDGWRIIRSKSHASDTLMEYLKPYPMAEAVGMSSALKFGLMAEGKADLYPRLGRTMEWDTAAGQAIVEAAGGQLTTLDGGEFVYGKQGFANPGFVVKSAVKK